MSNENLENINEEIINTENVVEETIEGNIVEDIIKENESSNDGLIIEQAIDEQPQPDQPIQFEEAHTMAMHSYTKLSDKYADVLSSATTMLLVGGVGMVLLICLMNGVFPINLGQTAWLFYSVMGAVFVAFIIAGFISYKNAMDLKSAATEEDKLIEEIKAWADENIAVEELDKALDLNDSIEELFFSRFATIKDKIMHQFETADESLIDELSEQIYQQLYENEDTVFIADEELEDLSPEKSNGYMYDDEIEYDSEVDSQEDTLEDTMEDTTEDSEK